MLQLTTPGIQTYNGKRKKRNEPHETHHAFIKKKKKVVFSQVKAHLLIYLAKKEKSIQDIILNIGHILKARSINGFTNNLLAHYLHF